MRGWTDLVINGSFWVGTALGAAASIVLLDPSIIDPEIGWRVAFLVGGTLGPVVFLMRMWIPESLRWLMTHGYIAVAETIVAAVEKQAGSRPPESTLPRVRLRARRYTPLREVFQSLFRTHRSRAYVGLALMVSQAFFYNAIFFTYALVLTDFYGIGADQVGWYILPSAAGNFLGPLLLGRLFDTIGRRRMIAFTYMMSGILLAGSGYLFMQGWLMAQTQTVAWTIFFFFASAAASSAYLTVSETFPLELRAFAIAIFYGIGTGVRGVVGPLTFGILVESGSRTGVFAGYGLVALLMIGAAMIALRYSVNAERKPLEAVVRPLAFTD